MTHRQLVALCSCPCSNSSGGPGSGFQVVGVGPVHRDPTIVDDALALVPKVLRNG